MGKDCLYPHIGLTVEAFGEVRLCTSAMDVEFDLRHQNIDLIEVLNSESIALKRRELASGVFPATCRSCKKVEESGVRSKREIFNQKRAAKYGSEKVEEILRTSNKRPMHMSIGFSNSCNLQCSMCSSKYSQAWASDELAYNTDAESKIDIFSSFAMDNKALDQLVELASDCSDIFIKGGEPFYSKEAIYFLKKLRKLESRPHIFTQTNGTVISTEIKSLIEDLNIEIGISIDGVGETYEWIRGFSYDQLISNISTFSRLSTDHKISLDFTASLFNCASLSESLKGFKVLMQENAKIGHVSLFSIARQARNSFLSLPLEFREQELESLLAYKDIGLESLEVLEKTLMQEQSGPEVQKVALHWLNFLESKRGKIPARKKDRFSQWAKGVIS